ncbi:MAG: McrC family protein [Bacteriovoracaceae bacterium]|nr:McrC family protein [Bacteriovoracaceae bacterium]
MKRNSIDIFEHETLHVASSNEDLFSDDGKRVKITSDEFISLQRFHYRISSNFYSLSHKKIILKHYVGLLRVGKLNINILPKIDKSETDTRKWHNILIQMIMFTKSFRYKRSTISLLKVTDSSILDLYIYEFYKEIEEVLRQGLRRSYSFKDGNISGVKGKILFTRDVIVNSSDKSKTFCRYQVYKPDNILNYILHLALKVSLNMTSNMSLIETGKNLLSVFPDVGNHVVNSKVFNKITFNRNNSYYKSAISLAKLIIHDTGLDLSSGSENVVSFLFDMNQLFEEFMYKICKKEFKEDEYQVHRSGKRFWEKKLIKPDIVIENAKCGYTVIFDTKWKIPKDLRPSDADLKQIFVYNHYYSSPVSYLLYPSTDDGKAIEDLILPGDFQNYALNGEELKNSCYLGFMPISSEGKLDLKGTQERIREMYLIAMHRTGKLG